MTIERELINQLLELGVSTTLQARTTGVSVNVIKEPPARALCKAAQS